MKLKRWGLVWNLPVYKREQIILILWASQGQPVCNLRSR